MRQVFLFIIALISFCTMKAQETPKIKITVGTTSFFASTYDNVTAKAFVELLPMTINMSELNGNEKYHYLSVNLPGSSANPGTINAGDIMLWGQNCVVLFYESFSTSYSYTKIGTVDNPAGLKTALGNGNPTVMLETYDNQTSINNPEQKESKYRLTNDGIIHYSGIADRLSLIDLNGKTIVQSQTSTLNVNSVPSGIYILLVEENQVRRKIKLKI